MSSEKNIKFPSKKISLTRKIQPLPWKKRIELMSGSFGMVVLQNLMFDKSNIKMMIKFLGPM